jgi:hypothetical protein
MTSGEIHGGQSGTGAGFSLSFLVFHCYSLFHHCFILLSLLHEVCDGTDQEAHYHTRLKVLASSLTLYWAGLRVKVVLEGNRLSWY